jgi:molybdate transport repressor ModE-like protein
MVELDVRRMLLLAEVARHGSLTAAARALTYTPSAVSQQISKLETEAGQSVLERNARGITLTDAGRALVRHAERIDRQLRAARAELDDIAGLRAGTLRIGSFPTAGSSLLPLVVTRFTTRHPGVQLDVRSALRAGLIDMLHSRAVELALLWDYEWDRVAEDELTITHLLDDPTALLVAADHPLASRTSVAFDEVAHEQWVTRADHPAAEALDRSCRAAGTAPQIAFEAHDYQEAQAMVAVGLGIALAPRLALTNLRDDVRVIPIQPAGPARRILLARLSERQPTPAETEITDEFLTVSHTLPASLCGP